MKLVIKVSLDCLHVFRLKPCVYFFLLKLKRQFQFFKITFTFPEIFKYSEVQFVFVTFCRPWKCFGAPVVRFSSSSCVTYMASNLSNCSRPLPTAPTLWPTHPAARATP